MNTKGAKKKKKKKKKIYHRGAEGTEGAQSWDWGREEGLMRLERGSQSIGGEGMRKRRTEGSPRLRSSLFRSICECEGGWTVGQGA